MNKGETVANKTAVKKNAKRALKDAEKAVDKARKAVRKSSKKLRKQANGLRAETQKLAKKHAVVVKKHAVAVKSTTQNKKAAVTPVVKAKKPTSVVTPPLPQPQSAPTLIQLREQAKMQKIAGYSRLNKAALIRALA